MKLGVCLSKDTEVIAFLFLATIILIGFALNAIPTFFYIPLSISLSLVSVWLLKFMIGQGFSNCSHHGFDLGRIRTNPSPNFPLWTVIHAIHPRRLVRVCPRTLRLLLGHQNWTPLWRPTSHPPPKRYGWSHNCPVIYYENVRIKNHIICISMLKIRF